MQIRLLGLLSNRIRKGHQISYGKAYSCNGDD